MNTADTCSPPYAIGAFNVYNLEGIKAVIECAEKENTGAILQIHPGSLSYGGDALVGGCLAAARASSVPIGVHLDHSTSELDILKAIDLGFDSVMIDGSHLPFEENMAFTARICALAHEKGIAVEAELGRLAGTEDGLTILEKEAKMTDPILAKYFVEKTNVDALAVCIGNVHGPYLQSDPLLDWERLKAVRANVPDHIHLVLHGTSGLPEKSIHKAINLGVRKFNVNTEVRKAYLGALRHCSKNESLDLVDVMKFAINDMKSVVGHHIRLFRSNVQHKNF